MSKLKDVLNNYILRTGREFAVCGLLKRVMVMILLTIPLCSCSYFLNYKEHSMRENFYEHFDTFNLLLKMQKEDSHYYVIGDTWKRKYLSQGPNFKNNYPEMTESRWNDYRVMFEKADIESGIRNHSKLGNRNVKFQSASTFGYTWIEKSPRRVFKSFYACRVVKFDDQYRCYVHLKDNWYLHMGANNEPI